jgi:shikimate 5-dehydrogenase
MHNAAFRALGLDWRYVKLPVPPALFAETVRALPGSGFRGANVTIPHKHAALGLADERTPSADAIGAANTLTFLDGGGIEADNTDAPGFVAALGEDARGLRALVLGALKALQLDDLDPPPIVADRVYGESPTALLGWAERGGSRTVDGLEVLVRQGALSFQRWTGIEPPIEVMRRAAASS